MTVSPEPSATLFPITQNQNWGLLRVLPLESGFQLIGEVSDLKRLGCPAPWKAAPPSQQVTRLSLRRVSSGSTVSRACGLRCRGGDPSLRRASAWVPGGGPTPCLVPGPGRGRGLKGGLAGENAGNEAFTSPEGWFLGR